MQKGVGTSKNSIKKQWVNKTKPPGFSYPFNSTVKKTKNINKKNYVRKYLSFYIYKYRTMLNIFNQINRKCVIQYVKVSIVVTDMWQNTSVSLCIEDGWSSLVNIHFATLCIIDSCKYSSVEVWKKCDNVTLCHYVLGNLGLAPYYTKPRTISYQYHQFDCKKILSIEGQCFLFSSRQC